MVIRGLVPAVSPLPAHALQASTAKKSKERRFAIIFAACPGAA
jgi:hypothetical protein